jgi:hypothetical protein
MRSVSLDAGRLLPAAPTDREAGRKWIGPPTLGRKTDGQYAKSDSGTGRFPD